MALAEAHEVAVLPSCVPDKYDVGGEVVQNTEGFDE
jgi:hypothetical protein